MRSTASLFGNRICFATWLLAQGLGIANGAELKVGPPGVVIAHSAASSQQYIGSPSIAVLSNGNLVVSHDLFGPGSSKAHTRVFGSANGGKSWEPLAGIEGQWWSTLFTHREALYLIGTSRENGFVVIRRSTDGGKTWTTPKDADTGLLLDDGKYHCAPVPVIEHNGRLWRAMEDTAGPGGWAGYFRAFMMSASAEADLLKAENWRFSNRLEGKKEWLGGKFGGWLEGNAVVAPDGGVVDVLRVDYRQEPEKAAVVKISADGREAEFDPESGFMEFPGGCKKFTIRFDSVSKKYWALSNYVPPEQPAPSPDRVRNTLALVSSPDLRSWKVESILLRHPDAEKHGFQYVDWRFDGEDIIAASRTAYDDAPGGAHNQHDANYLTFHRIRKFRALKQ